MNAEPGLPRRRGRPPSGGREAIIAATLELLRERGIANLTSREVAARAGVSDASVYYHFGDRAGLLQAVFEHGMQPLKFMEDLDPTRMGLTDVLAASLQSLEQFFDEALPVLLAAQADPELGSALSAYVERNDLGPHRGVEALGAYIRGEQDAGRVDPTVDAEAAAMIVIDTAFSRAARRQMLQKHGGSERLPTRERSLAALVAMLQTG